MTVELDIILILLVSSSRSMVELTEHLRVQIGSVESPQDVLEVEGAMPVVDQHHGGQMIVSVEILKRIL